MHRDGHCFFWTNKFFMNDGVIKKKMNDGREIWNVLINKTTLFFFATNEKGVHLIMKFSIWCPFSFSQSFIIQNIYPNIVSCNRREWFGGGVYLMWTADVIILVKIVNINNINNICCTCVGCVILMFLCTWLVLRR